MSHISACYCDVLVLLYLYICVYVAAKNGGDRDVPRVQESNDIRKQANDVPKVTNDIRYPHDAKPYRYFSTRTAYEVARGREVKVENIPGYKVTGLYMLVRHGTRYPGQDEIEAMQDMLYQLRDIIIHNTSMPFSASTMEGLRDWKLRFDVKDALQMTKRGLQEMYHIGRRVRLRFPSLATEVSANTKKMDLRHSQNFRNELSARHFAMGFLERELTADEFTESIGYSVPNEDDRLLLYCDLCHKYIFQRMQESEPERSQAAQFNNGPEFKHVLSLLNEKYSLGSNKTWTLLLLSTVMEACRFEFAVLGDSTWCDVLPVEAIQALEYRQDLKYYWRYGHGRDVNYQPACVLVQDILNKFRSMTAGDSSADSVVLRFGHSRTILPLLVRLGLFNETASLTAGSYQQHRTGRQWQLARINPFSSNLALTLYERYDTDKSDDESNDKSDDESDDKSDDESDDTDAIIEDDEEEGGDDPSKQKNFYVRAFLNEHEITLPGCDDALCDLQVIQRKWKHIESTCKFEDICDEEKHRDLQLADLRQEFLHHA